MFSNWKTTLAGAVGAGLQAVAALADWDKLPASSLAIRFALAALTFISLALAHDPKPDA